MNALVWKSGPRCGGGLPALHAGGFRVARFDTGVETGLVFVADGDLRFDGGAHFGGHHSENGEQAYSHFRCCCFSHSRHTSIHSIGNANGGL